MILTQLSVENFGLFRDKHVFDLTPKGQYAKESWKPIILFGGNNGAGKTTLFEAFKLCLYGKYLPEFRIGRIDYEDYLRKKIHRTPDLVLQPASTVLSVEFEYARSGNVDSYRIVRRWHIVDRKIEEQFEVFVNGRPFDEVDTSHWQDFIKEIIPIGVSKLFFFDGEQIQALADDSTDELRLKESFYSLLGLDLVDRLRSDLSIHLSKHEKQTSEKYTSKLEHLNEEHNKTDEQISEAKQRMADLQNKIANREKKVIEIQDRLSNEGGHFAKKRNESEENKTRLHIKIEEIYNQIRQMCSELLPFAIAPEYCNALKQRLLQEQQINSELIYSNKVDAVLKDIESKIIKEVKESKIDTQLARKLIANINNIFHNSRPGSDPKNLKNKAANHSLTLVNYLSALEQSRILDWIDASLNQVPTKLKELTVDLDSLTTELQKTEDTLKKAPPDEVIGPLIIELNKINQEIGNLELTVKQAREEISGLQYKLKNLDFQITSLNAERKSYTIMRRGLVLANTVQGALLKYENRVKEEKLGQLSESLLDCLNELMHKEIFQKAVIDPHNFSVTLFDKSNNAIPKEQLSLGEKQIYAIAILWALARTSGRPLPFIVDTPLGRLDSEHRSNLVQNFFPHASQQVIIFSTDTEIDKSYFNDMHSHISKSYKLEYENERGCTRVLPGYFWRNVGVQRISSDGSTMIQEGEEGITQLK